MERPVYKYVYKYVSNNYLAGAFPFVVGTFSFVSTVAAVASAGASSLGFDLRALILRILVLGNPVTDCRSDHSPFCIKSFMRSILVSTVRCWAPAASIFNEG